MLHRCKVLEVERTTPSISRLLVEKPLGFRFVPGHSIMVSIDKAELREEKHPLTFTSTNDDAHLEFYVKAYPERRSFNNFLIALQPEDFLLLSEMFGTIRYAGSGLFLAGGIGVAPFLAIVRQLAREGAAAGNTLVYSAQRHTDIIAENELRQLLGSRLRITLTQEKQEGYEYGGITRALVASLLPALPRNIHAIGSEAFVADMRSLFTVRYSEL